jgi:hypothetical protein
MNTEKINLRYKTLFEKYGATAGKREYCEIMKISLSTLNKYLEQGGINLVPYKKYTLADGDKTRKNNCKVYWDVLDIAIALETLNKVL